MLKRDEPPTTPHPASDLLLGRGARFEGKLTFEGTVRIDATFIGSIVTNDVLVVGEAARIDADITCGTIVVHGEVNGNIKAKTAVEIHQTAKVRGDLETPSLVVLKGALFHGASRMEQAASRAEQAASRTEQAASRTEQAASRTEQSPSRTEQGAPRIEQSSSRMEAAGSKAAPVKTPPAAK